MNRRRFGNRTNWTNRIHPDLFRSHRRRRRRWRLQRRRQRRWGSCAFAIPFFFLKKTKPKKTTIASKNGSGAWKTKTNIIWREKNPAKTKKFGKREAKKGFHQQRRFQLIEVKMAFVLFAQKSFIVMLKRSIFFYKEHNTSLWKELE